MLLRDMVYDGHVPGLRVAPEWWEPRHPQEYLPPVDDPVALRDPAPDRNRIPYTLRWPLIDGQFQPIYTPQANFATGDAGANSDQPVTGVEATFEIGTVSFLTAFEPDASEAALELGTVNVINTFEVTGVEMTAAIGDREGATVDQPETGVETGSEVGTADVNAAAAVTGIEAAAEIGTVTTIVVEAGWGAGAWGEGTWGN